MYKKIYTLLVLWVSVVVGTHAQEYHGTTGLLQVPSAETDSAGTFRGNMMFLSKEFTPNQMAFNKEKYNTFNYGVGLTVWDWVEISYCASLLKMYKNHDKTSTPGYYNEDRRVNVKFRPLKEGRWWPAIAVGMDDIGRFQKFTTGKAIGNNYYQNIYIAGSKHFNIHGYELGAHLAYRYYSAEINAEHRGVVGGVTLRPAFYRPLRFIAEWDGVGVNVGADVLLWRHLFIQACLVHGRGFTGGLSYHYTIPY